MIKIIDRYVSSELLRTYILIIVAVVVLMLTVRIPQDVDLIIRDKAPIILILKVMLYRIPSYIVMGMPLAYLVATLMALARLAKDNEITSIRSCGINFKRIVLPILILSVFVSYIGFLFNEEIVPYANKRSQEAVDIIKKQQTQGLVSKNIHFKGVDTRFFSINKVDRMKHTLKGIMIFNEAPKETLKLITASRGLWNQENTQWILYDGIIHEYTDKKFSVVKEAKFKQYTIDSKVVLEDYLIGTRNPKEMSAKKLKKLITAKKIGGQDTKSIEVDYQIKFAKPLASFFSAIIAAPVGLRFSRIGGYVGVTFSIILIFIYLVAESIGTALGNYGLLSPFMAAWAPNIIFAVIGFFMLWEIDR